MQSIVLNFHSILRYFILLFAVIVVIQSLAGILGKRKFLKSNKMGALALLIFCDLQLLLGFALYFLKGWASVLTSGGAMANKYNRFWTVEHSVGMLVAIILVHVGYAAAKKNMDDARKFKRLLWCVLIALIIFVGTIPWAQRGEIGRPNFPVMSS